MLSPNSGTISELSLLDHYSRGDNLTPSYRCYPSLSIRFTKPVQENSSFDQFLTKCYLRAEDLSPNYPSQITIAEVILLLAVVPDVLFY